MGMPDRNPYLTWLLGAVFVIGVVGLFTWGAVELVEWILR